MQTLAACHDTLFLAQFTKLPKLVGLHVKLLLLREIEKSSSERVLAHLFTLFQDSKSLRKTAKEVVYAKVHLQARSKHGKVQHRTNKDDPFDDVDFSSDEEDETIAEKDGAASTASSGAAADSAFDIRLTWNVKSLCHDLCRQICEAVENLVRVEWLGRDGRGNLPELHWPLTKVLKIFFRFFISKVFFF